MDWIPATKHPHPTDCYFVGYFGNGSGDVRLMYVGDGYKDNAISHWSPVPKHLPTLGEEYNEMCRVLNNTK